MTWQRGCDAEMTGSTVTGGPYPDDVTATITMLFGPRAPVEVRPGVFTGWRDPATGLQVDYHYGVDIDGDVPGGPPVPLLALG